MSHRPTAAATEVSDQELDRAHAELHYGKYSAGYNRGLARGRTEQAWLISEREKYRDFLKELDRAGVLVLRGDYLKKLRTVLWGDEGRPEADPPA